MPLDGKGLYEFGNFRLDPRQRLLYSDGDLIPLAPKAFDTLLALVQDRGNVVEKDELLQRIWPDTFVEELGARRSHRGRHGGSTKGIRGVFCALERCRPGGADSDPGTERVRPSVGLGFRSTSIGRYAAAPNAFNPELRAALTCGRPFRSFRTTAPSTARQRPRVVA
jgi:Transcriptional regulatory protein, C terminal